MGMSSKMAASRYGLRLLDRCQRHQRATNRPIFSVFRSFSADSSSKGNSGVPLSQPLPGVAQAVYAVSSSRALEATRVTELENGIKVATQDNFGQFCTIGVLFEAGSRYEIQYPSGISHFIEKLAYGSTDKFGSKDEILRELEKYGGICDCQSSRDTTIYAMSAESHGLPSLIHILSEVILKPKLTTEELSEARTAIRFELEDLNMRPDPEPQLTDLIHAAGFENNTVGLPKVCPAANVDTIGRPHLLDYMSNYYAPSRQVVAGVGVDHDLLVDLIRKHFVDTVPVWSEVVNPKPTDNSIAQYIGGIAKVERDMSNISPGTPVPNLVHATLGLESCGYLEHEQDFVTYCVLNMLYGGGGSFSAGGPGKGMYTRLYLNVLNHYGWMYNATAVHHNYADSGMLCIQASTDPAMLRDMIEVIIREFVNMTGPIGEVELNRAKTQLKSVLMMNLESRPVLFEDVGRQVLAQGYRKSPEDYCRMIDRVTENDLRTAAGSMLKSKPSVCALGDLAKLPSYQDILSAFSSKNGRLPKTQRLFSFL